MDSVYVARMCEELIALGKAGRKREYEVCVNKVYAELNAKKKHWFKKWFLRKVEITKKLAEDVLRNRVRYSKYSDYDATAEDAKFALYHKYNYEIIAEKLLLLANSSDYVYVTAEDLQIISS